MIFHGELLNSQMVYSMTIHSIHGSKRLCGAPDLHRFVVQSGCLQWIFFDLPPCVTRLINLWWRLPLPPDGTNSKELGINWMALWTHHIASTRPIEMFMKWTSRQVVITLRWSDEKSIWRECGLEFDTSKGHGRLKFPRYLNHYMSTLDNHYASSCRSKEYLGALGVLVQACSILASVMV